MDTNHRIKRFPANQKGRDYVVGDLHGTTALFNALLTRLSFDPAIDRLFSVGDLMDRGPDSPGALSLLRKPWFWCVKGNHEAMLEDYLLPRSRQRYVPIDGDGSEIHPFLLNGGDGWFFDWERETTAAERSDLSRILSTLPLLLVVGAGPERFHVVHASLVREYEGPSFTESSLEMDDFGGAVRIRFFTDPEIDAGLPWEETRFIPGLEMVGTVEESLLWDRSLVAAANLKRRGHPVEGLSPDIFALSRTYCGHTPIAAPILVGSHRLLDTGAYLQWRRGTGLSICDPRTDTVWTARLGPAGEVEIETRSFLSVGR